MGHPANLRRQQRLASTRMDAKLRRRLYKGQQIIWQNEVTTPILGWTPKPEKNWEEEMAKLVRRRRAVMDELTWVTRHRRTSEYTSPQESAAGFTWIRLLMCSSGSAQHSSYTRPPPSTPGTRLPHRPMAKCKTMFTFK